MTNFFIALQEMSLSLNFVCHVIIFLGGFYVAIHSRLLPKWLVTCIWYIGISSWLAATSILLGWMIGEDFPLSYSKIGLFTELLLNINLAITVLILFSQTLINDISGAKRRRDKIEATKL